MQNSETAVRNKWIKKYRENNVMIPIYVPKGVKSELDKYCQEKDVKKSKWILAMIIEELENEMEKRYDYKTKKFVEPKINV